MTPADLVRRTLAGEATPEDAERFQACWRQRLYDLLVTHADDPLLVSVQP